jgi:AI-2 transport protein TqsA
VTADPPPAPESGPVVPRGLVILLTIATMTVVVAGLRGISGLLGPTVLALILVIAVHPLRNWLAGRGAPGVVGSIVCILAAYGIILALAGALVFSVAELAHLLPQYQPQLDKTLDDTQSWLLSVGIDQEQISTVLSNFDLQRLAGVATDILSGTLSLLSNLFFIAALILFFAIDGSWFPRLLESTPMTRAPVVGALRGFSQGTRRYLVVSTVFGLIVAAIDTLLLWALGVPAPLVWGVLAFITNYIPNIGFVLGLIPPALLALLAGGWTLMLWVIIGYSVINVVIQSVIQPKVVGDQVGLSASLTFLSLVFWAWVLGPLGALLAVPLSLLSKAILVDCDPDTAWLRPLISGRPDQPVTRARPTPDQG